MRPSPQPATLSRELARDLARALPHVRCSDADVDRTSYARDLWPRHHLATRSGEHRPDAPAVVVWPDRTEEVAEIVRFATARGVPVVPFGAGSGVCGGVLPSPDAIVLDLKRLGRERSLDPEAMRLDIEAGALGLPLEESLERRGLTLGHFPSSILCSTVGGWVATRSAGQASGYYGKIEDMVVALECVTAAGEIVRLPRRRVGPDLSALIVGSEGALGIVTSATLRVHAAPRERAFAGFTFRTVAEGLEAMRRIYQSGLRPAVCRLYDPFDASLARSGKVKARSRGPHAASWWREAALRTAIARAKLLNSVVHGSLGGRMLGGALLVMIFERSEAGVAAGDRDRAQDIARTLGAKDEGEGPARRWLEHRYSVSFRQSPALRSGLFVDTFEVAAPWSRLGAVYDGVRRALGKHAFVMAHFSHAYPDGCCIYFSFAGTARFFARGRAFEPDSAARYDSAWRDGMAAAIEAGATVAHHHGVGRSKAAGMAREIEGSTLAMRALKRALDPHGILNPGVLAPIDDAAELPPLHRPPPDKPPAGFIDEDSRLALVEGTRSLDEVVRELRFRRYRLAGDVVPEPNVTVADWLAAGAPGAPDPFADPVDHVVAGATVELPHGHIVVPPVPRRATGPDFTALAIGAEGAYGARIASAWVRVEPVGSDPTLARPFAWNGASTPSEAEQALVARIAREL